MFDQRQGCPAQRKETAMTQSTLVPEPEARVEERDEPEEEGLVAGRPIEDRTFEMVEVAAGAAAGLAIGTAVAGPVGMLVGGVAGAAAGLLTGEAVERRAGRAATTTDAGRPEPGERG
jgi:hypothetical protein